MNSFFKNKFYFSIEFCSRLSGANIQLFEWYDCNGYLQNEDISYSSEQWKLSSDRKDSIITNLKTEISLLEKKLNEKPNSWFG